ncbi:MAG: hypothetical protein M4579_000470 [Chaenotheca gracillima]|nr:MAG: hypothetical protein M4579_000470 [Chaenotheca gracillima]
MDYPPPYPHPAYAAYADPRRYPPPTFEVQVPAQRAPPQPQQYNNYVAYPSQYDPRAQLPPPLPQYSPPQQYYPVPPHPVQNTQPPPNPQIAPKPVIDYAPQEEQYPALEYEVLLLYLSEEYLRAAHDRGMTIALGKNELEVQQYHKLVASGLACLESVLKKWRLRPRQEAIARLRYASILYEETENSMETEEQLGKGITLCDRNRLLDLKYQMQYLSIRATHQKSPKAAMKSLDSIIPEIEAYQHVAWVYAFRLLRMSLFLETPMPNDTSSALQNMRQVSAMASHRADHAARRAVAQARSLQTMHSISEAPQLSAMIEILDVLCVLSEPSPSQAKEKLNALHAVMNSAKTNPHWTTNGTFQLPIRPDANSNNTLKNGGGVLNIAEDGSISITFTWLPANDVIVLVYFLTGLVYSFENSYNGSRAEQCFISGLQMSRDMTSYRSRGPQSLSSAVTALSSRRLIQCYFQIHLIFTFCARADWSQAQTTLNKLNQEVQELDPDSLVITLIQYLSGIVLQGRGQSSAALEVYDGLELDNLKLNEPVKSSSQQVRRDIAILAILNKVSIIRDPSHPRNNEVVALLTSVEQTCVSHSNQGFVSAFYLLRSTSIPSETIIKTKQFLQFALNAAKKVSNQELLCLTLNFMSWKFFRGVVSEQAEKSAQAAYQTAQKSGNSLWINVAKEMMSGTLEVQGKMREAEVIKKEAAQMAEAVVPATHRPRPALAVEIVQKRPA